MKKEIAFIINSLTIGGVERVLVSLLNAIDYEKYEVTLYLKNSTNLLFLPLIPTTVHVKKWGESNIQKNFLRFVIKGRVDEIIKGIYYRVLIRKYVSDWIFNEYYEAKIYAQCEKEKYDCVVVFQGLYPGPLVTGMDKFDAPMKIAWIHGKTNFNEQQKELMGSLYSKYNQIFCVSEDTKKDFCCNFPDCFEKTKVFYNLVDRKFIEDQAKENVNDELKSISIMTVGRLSRLKGQLLIPKTVRMLRNAGYEIFWYLVGDGELRRVVEDEIEKYNVEDFVVLLGKKENPYPYIKRCDIYVQPSLSEGYCTTTMEAKVLNKVIITTDAPGMREQFKHEKNGFIVSSMTSEALFEGIKNIIDNPDMGERFVGELSTEINDNYLEIEKLYSLI